MGSIPLISAIKKSLIYKDQITYGAIKLQLTNYNALFLKHYIVIPIIFQEVWEFFVIYCIINIVDYI